MADNVRLDPGSGGALVATDDIDGIQHQRVKVQHGADGSATDVSPEYPLPVADREAIELFVPGNLRHFTDLQAVDAAGILRYSIDIQEGTSLVWMRITIEGALEGHFELFQASSLTGTPSATSVSGRNPVQALIGSEVILYTGYSGGSGLIQLDAGLFGPGRNGESVGIFSRDTSESYALIVTSDGAATANIAVSMDYFVVE